MDSTEDIERQLKELERDKRLEEIRQLRANAKTRWITPAALAALLPLIAGFTVWIVGELKVYNAGYRALAEVESLRKEKEALQREKMSLNVEVSTMLQLKTHYASEAERLQRDTFAKQEALDRNYLRGVFTSGEAIYALDHMKGMGPPVDQTAVARLRSDAKQLPKESAAALDRLLGYYELSLEIIPISRQVLSEFDSTLKLIPVSEWTKDLQSMPTGYFLAGRKIMESKRKDDTNKYYDVIAGRFLTPEEARNVR
jgi:hypothetical protein